MYFTPILWISLFAGLVLQLATAATTGPTLKSHRTSSILSNPAPQPKLPSLYEASQAAAAVSLNLTNVQGDILIGMKKKVELFFFFHINNPPAFKKSLKALAPSITTITQLLEVSTQPDALVNVAFSFTGLSALGVNESLNAPIFSAGQFADAASLGDPGTTSWVPAFKGTNLAYIKSLFGNSLSELHTLKGQVRPGDQEGHEHFGFMVGISQPGIIGFIANPEPGQAVIDAGHILLSETGDPSPIPRPAWAKDGSFLAFRQLKQLVPEFRKFLADNPIIEPGLTREQGSALMGARMVGRWKSGAPIDLAPMFDDRALANDPHRNNNFNFSHPDSDINSDQTRCPFSAHMRKTAPRADFTVLNTANRILRGGVPYGPEVSFVEAATNKTIVERGLAFVAYQTDLREGFHLIQQNWANNVRFFPNKTDPTPGFDPIIGANAGQPRFVHGLDPTNANKSITLVTDFVQSRGGEYFFSPSISAIFTKLST